MKYLFAGVLVGVAVGMLIAWVAIYGLSTLISIVPGC